jgi:hypothetical protein
MTSVAKKRKSDTKPIATEFVQQEPYSKDPYPASGDKVSTRVAAETAERPPASNRHAASDECSFSRNAWVKNRNSHCPPSLLRAFGASFCCDFPESSRDARARHGSGR